MESTEILYETPTHWVSFNGRFFEVWRMGICVSTRVASVGGGGDRSWLTRAIAECDKRSALADETGVDDDSQPR